MSDIDVDALRRNYPLADVAARYGLRLERDGHEFRALCPFHAEDTPSFTIFPARAGHQLAHCFGCGWHGDVVDFVGEMERAGFRDAVAALTGGSTSPAPREPQRIKADPYAGLEFMPPPPDAPRIVAGERSAGLLNPKRDRQMIHYTPSLVHLYPGVGYVLRVDLADGRKITPAILWARDTATGWCGWCHGSMPAPRPLYGLDRLAERGLDPVLVVEGEKCADASTAILNDYVTVSWAGGGKAWSKTDWTALRGADVTLWPDLDLEGIATMKEIGLHLAQEPGARVRLIDVIGLQRPDGWDIADAIANEHWGEREILAFIDERARPYPDSMARYAHKLNGKRKEVVDDGKPSFSSERPRPASKEKRTGAQADFDVRAARPDPRSIYASKLLYDKKGQLVSGSMHNFAWMLRGHPELYGVLGWNEFAEMPFLMRRPPWRYGSDAWRAARAEETDITETKCWLETKGLYASSSDTREVMRLVSCEHSFNPMRDYLAGLQWDGLPRLRGDREIDTFAIDCLGCPPDKIYSTMVWKWFVAGIARVMKPGCQVDTVLILESPQGYRKSTFFRSIATIDGDAYFCDDPGDISQKDSIIRLHGRWIVEIAELSALRRSDIYGTNAWITRRVDAYRPVFERVSRDVARQYVIGASVNPSGYGFLRDPTGARRFWPVPVQRIDIARVEKLKDQLWAEAIALYRAGEQWWLTEEEQAACDRLTGERRAEDPWSYSIDEAIAHRTEVRIDDLMMTLGVPAYQRSEVTVKRICEHLYSAGFRRASRRGEWYRPQTSPGYAKREDVDDLRM